jgi:ESF2/ABP1 family protein
VHAAKLRVELSQSKTEQQQYLKNVELARVLDKRAAKKREKGEEFELKPNNQLGKKRSHEGNEGEQRKKKQKESHAETKGRSQVPLDSVLKSIF